MMKKEYIFALTFLVLAAAVFAWVVLSTPHRIDSNLDIAIQGLVIFVALIASIIALSTANPKRRQINTIINVQITEKKGAHYPKSEFTKTLLDRFKSYPDPVVSHKIDFTIKNSCGFTLKKPVVSFKLPKDRQHP